MDFDGLLFGYLKLMHLISPRNKEMHKLFLPEASSSSFTSNLNFSVCSKLQILSNNNKKVEVDCVNLAIAFRAILDWWTGPDLSRSVPWCRRVRP